LVAEETADGGCPNEDEGDDGLEDVRREMPAVVFLKIGEDAADGDLGGGDLGGQGGDVGRFEQVGELLEGEVAAIEAVLQAVLVAQGSAGADVAAGVGGAGGGGTWPR